MGSDARFAFTAMPQTISGTDTTYTIAYETLYFIKDHLGSVRTITDSQGNILERNDSYPYGLRTDLGKNYATLPEKYRVRMPASFSDFSQNGNSYPMVSSPAGKMLPFRLLYNGKELQLIAQTRLIDYGARQYDPTIARWNGMDPMAEKDIEITPFSYCFNNGIIAIDSDGRFPWAVVAGIVIDYGFQVYSNYQADKSGYDAWIGNVDAISLALSAVPAGKGLQILAKETINSTVSLTINDGFKVETNLKKIITNTAINTVTSVAINKISKASSDNNLRKVQKDNREAVKGLRKSELQQQKHPDSPKKREGVKTAQSVVNETRKKEKMVSILNATIGQEPKTAEEFLEGTAKIFTLNNENNDGTQK